MTEQPKDIVLSNNDMHPAEEIAHLKDLLGKANALARIRAERIKELEAQAGAEPVAWVVLQKTADEIVRSKSLWKRFIDGTPLENDIACWMADFAEQFSSHPPARVQLTDEEIDAVIEAAHHSLRQYKYAVRGQQITQFDGIEAHVIRETERAHGIGGGK